MSKIRISADKFLDVPALTRSRLLIQANSGGGKSWATRWILEQTHGKVQQIIIDPEGEFSTLREKFDYILVAAGGGGDLIADPRYAAKLAEKLLETKADAIIDLYDLNPMDRKLFVKNFFTAAINVRKELYHECWFVLDEAHKFAPEKEESVALESVVDMASRGRKRGFCLIPCTQRPAKLNKDVAAECNNKLIGRASLDIDRKRSAEELGFYSKEEVLSLRNLEPGEFFAFGPAISRDVVKVRIGGVQTSHPDVGTKKKRGKVPPASASVKKILSQMKDLPAEAEEEIKTIASLKGEIARLKREAAIAKKPEVDLTAYTANAKVELMIAAAVKIRDAEWKGKIDAGNKEIDRLSKIVGQVARLVGSETNAGMAPIRIEIPKSFKVAPGAVIHVPEIKPVKTVRMTDPIPDEPPRAEFTDTTISGPEKKILDAIAWMHAIGSETPNRAAVSFVSGYSSTSSSYVKACGSLRTKGYVDYAPENGIILTEAGRAIAQAGDAPSSNEELHEKIYEQLKPAERKILAPIIAASGDPVSKADVAAASEYSETSSSYVKTLGKLRTLGLIDYAPNSAVRAMPLLFPV